jgi:hypothetical protein
MSEPLVLDGVAKLNYLVRCAHGEQETFDRFDPRTPEDQQKLKLICQDWNLANVALIDFVLQHGPELLKEIDGDD